MRRYFKLPFKPYLTIIDIMLFTGNKLIYQQKHSTPPMPFSNNTTFEFGVRYEDIKICNLPLETRLAFNIKIVSSSAEELFIGCCALNLFDYDGMIVSGYREVSVWPFC